MRIAIVSTFRHPTRLLRKERSILQNAAPELLAALCPPYAEVEIYNEKERDVPLDRHWDLVLFSYLDPFYEHTKVLSKLFRGAGMTTVAGGRHASLFSEDCQKHFDAVVVGEPEANLPLLIRDFERGQLQSIYRQSPVPPERIPPYRYDLVDFDTNRFHAPSVEASRGCPFTCNFCVLTERETYRFRPIGDVVRDITGHMRFNQRWFGLARDVFMFYDNNLGGSKRFLRELCETLLPMKKQWGCALTFNVLEDAALVDLMGRAGCRYVYTGLESLNPDSIESLHKRQNRLGHLKRVVERTFASGILLSAGLVVGTDGDTNEYLERVPDYLAEVGLESITFLGILCPYPGTPLFARLMREGRMLPGATSRDLDCYTVCHRPLRLDPSEVVDHYKRLCAVVGSPRNVVRYCTSKMGLSDRPRYKPGVLMSAPEIMSIRHNVANPERSYIAGRDGIEAWDAERMRELGLAEQRIA